LKMYLNYFNHASYYTMVKKNVLLCVTNSGFHFYKK